jgi:hypothetical protein
MGLGGGRGPGKTFTGGLFLSDVIDFATTIWFMVQGHYVIKFKVDHGLYLYPSTSVLSETCPKTYRALKSEPNKSLS